MSDIIDFRTRAKRASNAHSAFSPIIAQETINTQEARQKRRVILRNIRHGFVWGAIWIITLAAIGLFTSV